jgi:hypothetical protein
MMSCLLISNFKRRDKFSTIFGSFECVQCVILSKKCIKESTYRVSQNGHTNYLLPYRGCLNVHEKNMEKMFPTKKLIIFIIIIINGNTM